MSIKLIETVTAEKKVKVIDLPQEMQKEIKKNFGVNGNIGNKLLFENDFVRVWDIQMNPGERTPFHHHQLTYVYTPFADGKALTRWYNKGDDFVTVKEVVFKERVPSFIEFKKGEYLFHDFTNIGDKAFSFISVEMKAVSENPALAILP